MPSTKNTRPLSQSEAIREAIALTMESDERVIVIGEGVPDPKAIFGTTKGLRDRFGRERVFDMPLSENGITGACVGAAISGMRPILIHQRVDFAILSLDQLVNNAAKWTFMFAQSAGVPMVIRMIIGRGWGQGPQHSQSLQAIFAHIPGLKVVMPTTPRDAKGLMVAAVEDNNPVIFLEHRWLHTITDEVPSGKYTTPLGRANTLRSGGDVTVVSTSYATVQATSVARKLETHFGVSTEVVDLISLRPLDRETILKSVNKTGRLVVFDTGYECFGVGSEVIAIAAEESWNTFRSAPIRLGLPDFPSPTSSYANGAYYPGELELAKSILRSLNIKITVEVEATLLRIFSSDIPHDVPNPEYAGPF